MVLTQPKMSGVGHNALEIIWALERIEEARDWDICLVVTLGKKAALKRHKFSERIKIKVIPLPARVMEVLLRVRLLPPVDLLLGRGVYVFPNYKNWPLIASPSYLYVHDVVFMRYPHYVQPKNLRYLKKYVPAWIKRATKIITISDFSKHEIEHYFNVSPSNIAVIPCGVDRSVFYKKPQAEISRVKKKYGITAKHYLLYVGNIEPRKNLQRIVVAYSGLPKELKDSHALVLAGGGGWLNEGIHEAVGQAKKAGSRIIMPNAYVQDKDLPALFSGATALVHPALYEGFGLSPLQAMACSVPVIVAKNSSIPEVVGNAGLYVNPDDVADITDKMAKVMTDARLRARLVQKGLARSALFGWTQSAKKLLQLLEP